MGKGINTLAVGALFVGGLTACGADGQSAEGGRGVHDMDSHAATAEQDNSPETAAFDNFIEEHGTRLLPWQTTNTDSTLPGVAPPEEGAHSMHGPDVEHIVLNTEPSGQEINLEGSKRAHLSIPDGVRGRIDLGGVEVVRVAFLGEEAGGYNTLEGQALELFNPLGGNPVLEAFVRIEEVTVDIPL